MSFEINQEMSLSSAFTINEKEPKQIIYYEKKSPSNNVYQPPILSSLMNNIQRKNSLKTTDTNIYKMPFLNYNLKEIKKFDELYNSLSDISGFDLEKEKDENKSEFNSSENDNSEFEEEIIIVKSKRKCNCRDFNEEFEQELEEEYKEILQDLNIGKQ